jgi:hypothetical protein
MGLLDSYFDPELWPDQGGLLARLNALQQRESLQPDSNLGACVASIPATTVFSPGLQYEKRSPFRRPKCWN